MEERCSFCRVRSAVMHIPKGHGSTDISHAEVKQAIVEIKVIITL